MWDLIVAIFKAIFGSKAPVDQVQSSTEDSSVQKNWGDPTDVDKPIWNVIKINPDGIVVTYQEKYGSQVHESCIGLWENSSQYLLTWKDDKKIYLQKDNIVSIGAK